MTRSRRAALVALVLALAGLYLIMAATDPPTSLAQSGPGVPAPTEWQAQNIVADSLQRSCVGEDGNHGVQKWVKVGGFKVGRNGYCEGWTYSDEVICHLQPAFTRKNRTQQDRWRCAGLIQWETTMWTTKGPCVKQYVAAGGRFDSGYTPQIIAHRVFLIWTGVDGAPANKPLPWRPCDWGQYG